jgi:hypothetical protein
MSLKEFLFYSIFSKSYTTDPLPLPLSTAKAGRNHLNESKAPLLLTGIGERYSQTISNLGHAALLR